jgi:hypothetical protein
VPFPQKRPTTENEKEYIPEVYFHTMTSPYEQWTSLHLGSKVFAFGLSMVVFGLLYTFIFGQPTSFITYAPLFIMFAGAITTVIGILLLGFLE